MKIVRLQEQDLPQLASLYRELIDREACPEKMPSVFRAMRDNPDYLVLVAKEGTELIGSVMGVVCLDLFGKCNPFMVVENMIVSRASRHSGVGTLLMRELERAAAQRHCNYLMLLSNSLRADAHAFYEKLGYDPSGFRGFKKYL